MFIITNDDILFVDVYNFVCIVIICDNKGSMYVVNWLLISACMLWSFKTIEKFMLLKSIYSSPKFLFNFFTYAQVHINS